ncbi:MAG: sigma-70 factor domain-containing protein, partial [Elainella sp.]
MVITTERKRAAPVGASLVTSSVNSSVNSPASSSVGKRPFVAKSSRPADKEARETKEPTWPSAELVPELGALDALVELQPGVEPGEPALEGVDVQFTSASQDNSVMLGDAVRQYLVAIGRFPLLSAEQEVMFGRQVEQG